MPDVNQIIGFLMEELRADALRKDDSPFKLSKYQRDEMFNKLIRLQLTKGKVRKTPMTEQGLTQKNNVKLGRPRKDLNPDTPASSFMRELRARVKDEEKQHVQEPTEHDGASGQPDGQAGVSDEE